jgi:hypothetical protein
MHKHLVTSDRGGPSPHRAVEPWLLLLLLYLVASFPVINIETLETAIICIYIHTKIYIFFNQRADSVFMITLHGQKITQRDYVNI